METILELTEYVQEKAKSYLAETGEIVESFPLSIVDFVIEYVANGCHFPSHFTEQNIVSDLSRGKAALAMACVEVYGKMGAEGQSSHSENGISRVYEGAWISNKVLNGFPNYAVIL